MPHDHHERDNPARTQAHRPATMPRCAHSGPHAPLEPGAVEIHAVPDGHHHGHDAHHRHFHLGKAPGPARGRDRAVLLIALVITAAMMVAEVVGGLLTHSLALVSDGVHMFTHAFALALSYAALRLSLRPADPERTFGYSRIEVLAAFVNGLTILLSALWIVVEGVSRLIAPSPVEVAATLAIAVAGLLVNLVTGVILMKGDQANLNIRSAFLHMLTDTLSSIAIIAGLTVVHFTGWVLIDPLLALVVAAMIVKWAWSLIGQSLNVLLEGSPIKVAEVRQYVLAEFPEIVDMHDVHTWQISQRFNCLTAHLVLQKDAVANYTDLVVRLNESLMRRFAIGHTTFQPEW